MTGSTFRYGLVAALCMLLHNAVVIGLTLLGGHYAAACLLSFILVAATGFVLHGSLTFGVPLSVRGFLRYAAGMALNLPFSVALIWLFHDRLTMPIEGAAPLATLILLVWNYAASKWALRPGLMRAGEEA